MSFVVFKVFKESIVPIKHSFKGFVIQGGARGTILLISFGIKFVMIFITFLVNVAQLGSWLVFVSAL